MKNNETSSQALNQKALSNESKEASVLRGVYHLNVGEATAEVFSSIEWNLEKESVVPLSTIYKRLLEYDPSGKLESKLRDAIRAEEEGVVLKSLGIHAKSYSAALEVLDDPNKIEKLIENLDPEGELRAIRLNALPIIIKSEIAQKPSLIPSLLESSSKEVKADVEELTSRTIRTLYPSFKYGITIEMVSGKPQIKWRQIPFPVYKVCGDRNLPNDIQEFGSLTAISGVIFIPGENGEPGSMLLNIRDEAGQYRGTLGDTPAGHSDVEVDYKQDVVSDGTSPLADDKTETSNGVVSEPSTNVIYRALLREALEELGLTEAVMQLIPDSVTYSKDLVKPHSELSFELLSKVGLTGIINEMKSNFKKQQIAQASEKPKVGEGRILVIRATEQNLIDLLTKTLVHIPSTHTTAILGFMVKNHERQLLTNNSELSRLDVVTQTQVFADKLCAEIKANYQRINAQCTNGAYNPNRVIPTDQGLPEPVSEINRINPNIITRIIDPNDPAFYE